MVETTLLDDCNCFALRQAARFVTQVYERHLAPVGLTATQFTILVRIAKSPAIAMAELARHMVMDRTTLVRALAPLQRQQLLITEPSTVDKRAHLYSLSESGKLLLVEARVAWRKAQAEFEKKAGRDRAKFLREELFDLTGAMR